MRIVHVITGLGTGGAEMMLKKVISETGANFDHIVISLKDIGPVGKSLQKLGISVIALGGKSGRFSFPMLRRLATELGTARPDIVQAWMYHANLAAWAARMHTRAKWPLYWSIRCSLGEPSAVKWSTRLVRKVCAVLSGSVSHIIYNSYLARRQHEGIGYRSAKGVVIPNGFDTNYFRPNASARQIFRNRYAISNSEMIVGHVARADPLKDQRTLLAAASKVVEEMPNTVFVLAGTGIPRLLDAHGEIAASFGKRLILLPEQDNVNELMAALDVFVLSSIAEGFPNVLGEALSCGTPCIATNVGDCALIVGDQGIVVPSRDPDSLASAILKLLGMPEGDRKALGLAGRAKVQNEYSLPAIGRIYAGCWEDGSKVSNFSGTPCAG